MTPMRRMAIQTRRRQVETSASVRIPFSSRDVRRTTAAEMSSEACAPGVDRKESPGCEFSDAIEVTAPKEKVLFGNVGMSMWALSDIQVKAFSMPAILSSTRQFNTSVIGW